MLALVVTFLGLSIILIGSEVLWRKKLVRGEYGRKLVHIVTGTFVAFWPYYLSKNIILSLTVVSFVVLLAAKYTKIFHAIHDIKRVTIGEYLYPAGVFFTTYYAAAHWVFTVAILFVALADGMAAVVGKKWGKKKLGYKVFGLKKTYAGSAAYFLFALVAVAIGALLGGWQAMLLAPFSVFVALPFLTMLLESVSPYGIDNISVPVLVVFVLNLLANVKG